MRRYREEYALTLFKRGEKTGIRVYIDADKLKNKYFPKDVLKLFDKVVVKKKDLKTILKNYINYGRN